VLAGVAGTRAGWESIPNAVRSSVEHRLGRGVARAHSQEHGFSPALASRLTLTDGRRVFVKAIGPDHESGAPGGQEIYRREAAIAAGLPATVPAPRLLDVWEVTGWVVLAFEDIEGGHPACPWRDDELDRVLDAMTLLGGALTPSPVPAPPAEIPGGVSHWDLLAADPTLLDGLSELDPWIRANTERLADVASPTGPAFQGSTLLHTDIRADNILLTSSGVVFVDWPHARIGAPWIELLWFLPSVAMQGGPDPDDLFWSHPAADGADRAAVLAVLVGIAGFFVFGATQPPPPGLPTLRRIQLAQGIEAVAWLRQFMD
jgi:Phosphotransferase enzyme family